MKSLYILIVIASLTLPIQSSAHESPGKEIYLDLMEEAVHAYTPELIMSYTDRVDSEGITEHGFPRLTANIGILLSHGRLAGMEGQFERMMDICIREIPIARQRNKGNGTIGNDFSVKEIVYCLLEIESSGVMPADKIADWRGTFSAMKAEDIYSVQPVPGDGRARNWCVFGSASECARVYSGLGGDRSYADRYLEDQLRFFDCNGMYRDPGSPMVYDFVTRLQYMAALDFGYDGPCREDIEKQLLLSAVPTLEMQSATGEIPFGGRSNQFLLNETFYAAVCEYYARWFHKLGDDAMAGRFKAAAARAVAAEWYWLAQKPVRHIKNRYPTETGYGCEGYAYFDKYMVTMASWAYMAYRFADEGILPAADPEPDSTFVTSPDFHQIMMNAGGYTVQFDVNPKKEYDSPGIGRFQRAGAPPVIALASPCPSVPKPNYKIDIDGNGPLAIAPGWDKYDIVKTAPGLVILTDSTSTWRNRLSHKGLTMKLKGKGLQGITMPALVFDGESSPEVQCSGRMLTITFNGWRCTYRSSAPIVDSGRIYASRNGHLRRFDTSSDKRLRIRATIEKM